VTIVGSSAVRPEIDFQLNTNFVAVNQTTGSLTLSSIVLTNMPIGSNSVFPTSLLVGAVWPVSFDRPAATRPMLTMMGVSLVVPHDLFSYLSYWAGMQTSNIPLFRDQAEWLKGNVYFAQAIAAADDTKLVFTRREGQGTLWLNSTLTSIPYKAAPLLQKTGVTELVPGAPYTPFVNITPIYTAAQLAAALHTPPNTYFILMTDMQLSSSVIHAAVDSSSNGSTVNSTTAAGTSLCLPAASVAVKQQVLLIGRPGKTVILDFGGCSGMVNVSLERGSRLSLQRLVLTGLAPAASQLAVQPPVLRNLTAKLWAFNLPVGQVALRLQNVTLVVSQTELRALQQAMNEQYQWPGDSPSNYQRLSAAQLAGLSPILDLVEVGEVTNTSIFLTNSAYDGIDGDRVMFTSHLPAPMAFNITPPAQLVLGDASSVESPAPSPETGHSGLASWQKGIIGGFSALGGLIVIGMAAWGWVRVSRSRREALAAAAKSADDVNSSGEVHARVGSDAVTGAHHGWPGRGSNRPSTPGLYSAASNRATESVPSVPPSETVAAVKSNMSHASAQANAEIAALAASKTESGPAGASSKSSSIQAHPAGAHTHAMAAQQAALAAAGMPAALHNSAGSGKSSGKSGPTKRLDAGLAPGCEDAPPDQELHQLIHQQAGLTGIDMQQVEIEHIVGQGSFGVVYKGKWRSMTVAIKALMFQDAGAAKRVRQRAITEAAINTLLTHANIVNTYAYDLRPVEATGLPDGKLAAHWKLYIIQEFCDGGSLAQAIDRGVFMDQRTGDRKLEHILQVASDIARGMAYIHERQVVHGDLSSGNIMLRFEPRTTSCFQAKVCDFGLSRFLEGPEQSHISNARQGTPFYIAPEVLKQGIMSRDADVFSFGVLLWEMYTGRPPWRDPKVPRGALDHTSFKYALPAGAPQRFEALVNSCLYPEPRARPRCVDILASMSDMLNDLKERRAMHAELGSQGTGPYADPRLLAADKNGAQPGQHQPPQQGMPAADAGNRVQGMQPGAVVLPTQQMGVAQLLMAQSSTKGVASITPIAAAAHAQALTAQHAVAPTAQPAAANGHGLQPPMPGASVSLIMSESIDFQLPPASFSAVPASSVVGCAGSFSLTESQDAHLPPGVTQNTQQS